MAEHRLLKRPYRSKRNRPCDLCRSRKVHCHIEGALPCSLCAKYDMNCTFIMGPVKKHRRSTSLDAPAALNLEDEESPGRGNADIISLAIDGNLPLQSVMDPQRSHNLQRSPDRPFFAGQTILDGHLESNHMFDFGMFQFSTPSFSGAINAQDSSILLYETPRRDEEVDTRDNTVVDLHLARSPDSRASSNVNSIDHKHGVHGVYFGLSGDTDPYLLRHLPYDERGEFKMFKLVYRRLGNGINHNTRSSILRQSSTISAPHQEPHFARCNFAESPAPAYFMIAADELGDCGKEDTAVRKDVTPETVRMELDRLILPEDGRRLFGLFYKYVFPAFPVISRSQLNIGSFPSHSLPSTAVISKVPTHLLAAIYATALPFWHYDDHLCVMKAYKRPSANQIWRIVYEEILRDIHTPRLSVLQACLLYLQKQRAPQDSAAADTPFTWSFLAWTVGLATSLGLHVDCTSWDIPAWEKRLRRRLWWAVYSEEKFRSLLIGQPTIIRRDQWDVSDLKDEDFCLDTSPEEASNTESLPEQGKVVADAGLHSRYLAALAQIVDDLYQSLFTLQATRLMSSDFLLRSKTVKNLRMRLGAWHSSLPSSLRVQSPSNPNLDSNVSLNLAYITLEILLHRALLREVRQPEYHRNGTQTVNLPDHILPTTDEQLSAIERAFVEAMNSAKLAIEFTGDMTSRDFSGFWHSWSRICFSTISNFVMLLMVKAPSREYATTARSVADKWRETLRFQSRSCEQMNMGMLRLDAIYWTGIDNLFPHE